MDLTIIGLAIESKQAEASAERMLKKLDQLEGQADRTVAAFDKTGGGSSRVAGKLQEATGATSRLSGALGGLRGAATASLAAVATGVGVVVGALVAAEVAAIRLAISVADMLGPLQDAGEKTGISTDRLFLYKLAGDQAGVTFEKVTKGIDTFNRKLAEAAEQPQGKLAQAFKSFGLEATSAIKNPSVALELFADDLLAIQNPAERARATFVLFGESGDELLEVFKELNENQGEFSKIVDQLGGPSGIQRLVAASDELNKEFDKLGVQGEALKIILAQDLIPALIVGIRQLNQSVSDLTPVFRVVGKVATEILLSITANVAAASKTFGFLSTALSELGKGNFGNAALAGAAALTVNPFDEYRRLKKEIEGVGQAAEATGTKLRNSGLLGTGGRGKRATDKVDREVERLEDANFALARTRLETQLSIEKDEFNRSLALLKDSYDARLIAAGDYYRQKSELETKAIEAEIVKINALVNLEEKRAAKGTASEKVRAEGEILKLLTEQLLLERQLGGVQQENFDAYLLSLAKRAQAEREAAEEGARFAAEAQRRRDAIRTDVFFEKLDTRTTSVNIDRELGLLTEEEARKRILEVQREMRGELEKSLRIDLASATLADDPRRVEQIKRELEQLRLLGVELSNVQKFRKALFGENGTDRIFEDLGRDIRSTIKGAFEAGFEEGPKAFFSSLITGFRNALSQLASELLTSTLLKLLRQLFDPTASGGGGGGGILGGIFGFLSGFIGNLVGGSLNLGGLFGGSSKVAPEFRPGGLFFGSGRAMGGPVLAGVGYPVGERGMEFFVPNTNGRIVPQQEARTAAAPQVPVTVVVQGVTNPRDFVASADQIATRLSEAVERSLRLR